MTQSPLPRHVLHRLERGLLPSTGITRLPRYYEPIRLPAAPGPTFTGLRLVSRSTARWGLPCCFGSRYGRAVVTTPVEPLGAHIVLFPSDASFPCNKARSASTSILSRPAQRSLALQPAHSPSHLVTLSTGGFSRVVTSPTAPIATGWNDLCRKGLSPSQEPRLSTAHLIRDLPGAPGFLATVAHDACASARDTSVGVSGPRDFAVRAGRTRQLLPARPSHPTSRP